MKRQRAIPLVDWPQPNGGAPCARVVEDQGSLTVSYRTDAGGQATIHFPLYACFKYGEPNDEALAGHPLFGEGLEYYTVHRVENSVWIAELERQNSIHPRHESKWYFEGMEHYVFTFKDATLECVVHSGPNWTPEILHDNAKL